MRILAELTIVPLGVGISLSPYIAKITHHIRKSGLKIEEHGMGTNIEGEWDEIMALVKSCNQLLINMGAKRVSTSLKLSLRTDKNESLAQKLAAVADNLPAADKAD